MKKPPTSLFFFLPDSQLLRWEFLSIPSSQVDGGWEEVDRFVDLMPGRLGLMAFPVAFLLASIPMQCSTGENLRPMITEVG